MTEKVLEFCNDKKINIKSILILKNGIQFQKKTLGKDEKMPIYSATKTVLSLAVCKACELGFLTLETALADVFEKHLENMPQGIKNAAEKITLFHLLSMQVRGFEFRPEPKPDELEYSFLRLPASEPIFEFNYTNTCAYLAGRMLAEAVGKNGFDFVRQKVLEPLEIHCDKARFDSLGNFDAASGLYMTIDELSRAGETIRTGGIFNGSQIFNPEYIKKMTECHSLSSKGGFGLCVWIPDIQKKIFKISGKWGQRVFWSENKEFLITVMCDEKNPQKLELLDDYIIRIFRSL